MPTSAATLPFHQELARIMSERGVGQRELERRVGISQAHVSRVLSGKNPPSAALIPAGSKALELPADYFIEAQLSRIIEVLRTDPALRSKVYRMIRKRSA